MPEFTIKKPEFTMKNNDGTSASTYWTDTSSNITDFPNRYYGGINVSNEKKKNDEKLYTFRCDNCSITVHLPKEKFDKMLAENKKELGGAYAFCSSSCKLDYKYNSISLQNEMNENEDKDFIIHGQEVGNVDIEIDNIEEIERRIFGEFEEIRNEIPEIRDE
jgi:hypothetical protein